MSPLDYPGRSGQPGLPWTTLDYSGLLWTLWTLWTAWTCWTTLDALDALDYSGLLWTTLDYSGRAGSSEVENLDKANGLDLC